MPAGTTPPQPGPHFWRDPLRRWRDRPEPCREGRGKRTAHRPHPEVRRQAARLKQYSEPETEGRPARVALFRARLAQSGIVALVRRADEVVLLKRRLAPPPQQDVALPAQGRTRDRRDNTRVAEEPVRRTEKRTHIWQECQYARQFDMTPWRCNAESLSWEVIRLTSSRARIRTATPLLPGSPSELLPSPWRTAWRGRTRAVKRRGCCRAQRVVLPSSRRRRLRSGQDAASAPERDRRYRAED